VPVVAQPRIPLALFLFALTLPSCVLEPDGFEDEESRSRELGQPFEPAFAERTLPEIGSPATWSSLLARAFVANGELEAAWHRWSASLERVRIAGGWPDSPLAPSFSYLVSEHQLKAWDRTMIEVGFDSMQNLSWPSKVSKAAEVAFAEARAAGLRFEAAKFALQRRVLDAWLELTLHEEQIRLQRELVDLQRVAARSAQLRVQTGGAQGDLVRARVALELGENELASMEAAHHAMRLELNGLVGRPPDAPLELARELPPPRPIPVGDDELLRAGVARNPELAALAADVQGRSDAVELARLQFIPDFNPFVSITGGVMEIVGVGVSLPTTIPQLRAGVAEANAMLREADAAARQARFERGARFVAALTILRNAERQGALLSRSVLPASDLALRNARDAYASGRATLLELIDAQEVLLDVRRAIAEARIEREMRLAELEQLGGFDVETLGQPAGQAGPIGKEDSDARAP
jgi:cobalt-zinc-cadmium efflux system outer membrane protein